MRFHGALAQIDPLFLCSFMRVIITGATGLLGRAVYSEFSKTEHEGTVD
jgi:hypothetical protein